MYLNILKKDLKRNRAMNVILLEFFILASMLVSSSINDIISVTAALDNYSDMRKPGIIGIADNDRRSASAFVHLHKYIGR